MFYPNAIEEIRTKFISTFNQGLKFKTELKRYKSVVDRKAGGTSEQRAKPKETDIRNK